MILEDIATKTDLSEMRAEIAELREKLVEKVGDPPWPELISLKLLCSRCGLSYNTMRKREYSDQLPCRGKRDVVVAGCSLWLRETVLRWLEEFGEGS